MTPPTTPQPPSPDLGVDSEMRKALLALIEKLVTQNKALREALEGMLAHFGNPHRDEWLNDAAWRLAGIACAEARQALEATKP